MKKTSINCLLALAVVPVFCMCSKTNEVAERTQVTITANIEDTKVSLTQGEEKLILSWEEGDAINIIGTTTEKFTIKSGFTAKSAEFTGNEVTGSSFDIVYPSDYATKDAITARSYTGQVQNGNGSTAHLEYNAIIEGAADYQEISFAKGATGVKMNGALKLVVKLPDDVTAVSSLKLTAPSAIFYTTNGTSATSASLSMNFTNTTIGEDHILTAYMMTSWQDVTIPANTELTLDVTAPHCYSKTFHCTTEQKISGGATFVIDISSATLAYTLKGSGTETDPYLLYGYKDFLSIRSIIEENVNVYQYFKLMADIDMSSIDNWTPINDGNVKDGDGKEFAGRIHFDGNNKTLSNLKSTNKAYTSFFGVLIGSVKNLTFDSATISANSSSCGVVGGFIGSGDGRYGKAENVTIKNSSVTYNGNGANCAIAFGSAGKADIIGISVQNSSISYSGTDTENYVGSIVGGTKDNCVCNIKNCSCDEDVSVTNVNKAKGVGGIVGNIGHAEGEVIENCTFNGTITPGSTIIKYVGGIVGIVWVSGSNYSSTLKNCSNYAAINAPNCTLIGGITGYMQKGTIDNCHNYGKVTGKGTQGGIVGQCEKTVDISNCSNAGEITATGSNTGGIVGNLKVDGSTISKCYVLADISTSASNSGGIVGNMNAGKISECWYSGNLTVKDNSGGIAGAQSSTGATSDVIIENCYTTGTITNNGSQKCGGIAGECCKNSKIRNCFSTMNISGSGRVFGNIAGRFNNNGWNGNSDTDLNMEVTNSIAAGSINSTATDTGFGSSGALLGVAPCKIAHYTNCWRIYGYSFECAYKGTATLVDQGYTVTSYTVGTYAGGVGGSTNWWPYHASEASASALQTAYSGWTTSKTDAQITVSDIASATNYSDSNAWDTTIWDLSGDYPTLKNNPEPTL